jgi:hypothetical protein
MPDDIDVRRLRLQPGDVVVVSFAEAVDYDDARGTLERLRAHIAEHGPARTMVLFVNGGSVSVVPGAEAA